MVGETNHLQGFIGTVIVHSIFIAILFLVTLSASLPESENEGLLINFGNSTDGSGLTEPIVNYDNAVVISLPSHHSSPKVDEKKILTQDYEDAPTVESKKKANTKKETKKTVTQIENDKSKNKKENKETTNSDKTVQTQQTETPKQQTVNKKALFPGKALSGGTGGEGETGKEGNQGSLEGSPESTNRTGGATGGNGIGNGNGNVINFSLEGRKELSLPIPAYPKQKKGKVVVDITVDRQGNVTKANAGVKGSNTLDSDLLKAAEKAALSAKFDANPNAPAYQTGTITYIFKLD